MKYITLSWINRPNWANISVSRCCKAFFQPQDYQKALLDSLEAIETQSQKLMEEATKSHFYEFHICRLFHHFSQILVVLSTNTFL